MDFDSTRTESENDYLPKLEGNIPTDVNLMDDSDDDVIALSNDEMSNIMDDIDNSFEEGLLSQNKTNDNALTNSYGSDTSSSSLLHSQDDFAPHGNNFNNDLNETNIMPAVEAPPEFSGISSERDNMVNSIATSEGLDHGELRKMISYLDLLFDKLPEETIREFSRSEYFDLYKKIMTELGI